MQEAQNTRLVQDAYAAFFRSDLNGMLALMSDDVVWKGVTGASRDVPMSGVRHGKAEVTRFFEHVARDMTFSRFEPQQFVAQGEKVVVLGHYAATIRTGGTMDSDFVMVFTLRGGRIVEFQEFLDVSQLNAAYAVGTGAPVAAAH